MKLQRLKAGGSVNKLLDKIASFADERRFARALKLGMLVHYISAHRDQQPEFLHRIGLHDKLHSELPCFGTAGWTFVQHIAKICPVVPWVRWVRWKGRYGETGMVSLISTTQRFDLYQEWAVRINFHSVGQFPSGLPHEASSHQICLVLIRAAQMLYRELPRLNRMRHIEGVGEFLDAVEKCVTAGVDNDGLA